MAVIIRKSLSCFFVPITQCLIKENIIVQSQYLKFTHYIEEHTVLYMPTKCKVNAAVISGTTKSFDRLKNMRLRTTDFKRSI